MKKIKKESLKPSWWFSLFIAIYAKIVLFFRGGFKFNRKVLKQYRNGAIVLFNHPSNQDHFIITNAINGRKINFVLSGYYFLNPKLKTVLRLANAIKKDQFRPDLAAIRKIKKVLDNKGLVAIAPTGQVTIHGGPTYISPSIAKLIRLCKADVIALQIRGAHLRYPKWRKSERKCIVHSNFIPVLRKEEIEKISENDIYKRVCEAMNVNDYEDQLFLKRKITGDSLMSGLETTLIYCPKCHSKYQHIVNQHEMKCESCGNHVFMDEYGFIHPKGESDIAFKTEIEWYDYQKNQLKEAFLLNDNFCLQNKVDLYSNLITLSYFEKVGSGIVTLTKSELKYQGTIDNEEVLKRFNLEQIIQLPFSPGRHFEIPDPDGNFKFIPTDNINQVIEWVQIIDIMHELRESKKD